MKTKFYFYILRCKDKSLYCGIAKNLQARLAQHNSGKGSRYVHSRGGGEIIYSESFFSKSKALKREAEIKKWSKAEKELLIKL